MNLTAHSNDSTIHVSPLSVPPTVPSFNTPDVNNTVLLCPDDDSNCSHPNEVPFFEPGGDHGSACCVFLELSPGRMVMVGISHQKTHKK
mmetsp:Transcript_21794/g.47579  ORF Transcript_21794/g.47579 Transcript_21794/m.47579 type:complete len:89 (+) Transcript_21794:1294-1560(+)